MLIINTTKIYTIILYCVKNIAVKTFGKLKLINQHLAPPLSFF